MQLYCPNCRAPVEASAGECLKCNAVFGVAGWRPVPFEQIPPEPEPSFAGWYLFSPFLTVFATVVALGIFLGPAGPWLTPFIAPPAVIVVWIGIALVSKSQRAKHRSTRVEQAPYREPDA